MSEKNCMCKKKFKINSQTIFFQRILSTLSLTGMTSIWDCLVSIWVIGWII